MRRHVASPEPVSSDPEPVVAKALEPVVSEPAAPALQEPVPVEAPQVAATEAPVEAPAATEVPAATTEAPVAAVVEEPALVSAPAPTETPQQEEPKPAEPQTPSKLKPSMSRNASTASLTKSPGSAEKPEPKRRGTLTNWARRSLDRKPSGSGPSFARPPSRGALSGDDNSDTESVKERERGWNTGRPVPEPKKSEDNLKRRFSLGRRTSSSGHAKTPSVDSASESDKKPNWAAKVLRAAAKVKKEKGDGSSSTTDVTGTDATPEPLSIPDSRPSLSIPDNMAMDQRPLSAIVESPIAPLNPHALLSDIQPAAPLATVSSPLANTVTIAAESPVEVKPEDVHSEPEIIEAPVETPVEVAVAPIASPEPIPDDANPVEAVVVAAEPEPAPIEEAQPKVAEEVQPTVAEEVQPKAAEEVQPEIIEEARPKDGSGTSTPAPIETNGVPVAPQDMLSPMSPNSPSSTPWDPTSQREIARARSPRRTSAGGPSNRSRLPSPAPSIIGVKRKQPDEPEIVKSRVRYLPDWAISPAIQLAVTLSLVLPRRRRDAANPTNRKRGWWPLRRGTRTELRYNAIRGVNEEVPIVSRSWAVPAAVRTTAKVVTAPARWMFHLFVPRSSSN
ncbi:hypothetical protein FRC12_007562 [Ceratobasidium sp. 428]|nr:hypothetical protein FRC12_007562 [Ceratobasidium sp. 428]